MKNLIKFLVPVAAAAIALVSCTKEGDQKTALPEHFIDITVTATVNDLIGEDGTKTYIDANKSIIWGTGEYMKLALSDGSKNKFGTSAASSADANDGLSEASFSFSIDNSTLSGDTYTFMGLYPASAAVESNNTTPSNYKVTLPEIQNATSSSYDPAAYIMFARPEVLPKATTSWTTSFLRGTALNKVTLTNLNDDIISVEFKTINEGGDDIYLTGSRHIDLTTDISTDISKDIYTGIDNVTVKYATALPAASDKVIWFTTWGAEIPAGAKLKIIAKSATKSYTRELTARTGGINFKERYLNTLNVNMGASDVVVENISSLAGDYVILAKKDDSTFYALKGEASGTRIASVNYTGSLTNYNGDASLVWTIAASGTSYTIKNNGNYVGWTSGSGNAADLIAEADYDADKCLMSIDDNGDGTYKIYVTAATDRVLARNTSNAYFAFYGNTQYKDIVLVPATALEQVATPTFDPAAGAVASGSTVSISCATSGATIHYTVDGTDPTASSATYSSPITITATTTIKAIAVKSGMADSEIASATYTVAGATTNWELVTDFSTIESGGKYIFVNVQGSTSYYMKSSTAAVGSGTQCVALSLLPTDSGFVESDQMCVFLTGDTTNGFIVSNADGKELFIKNTNNGLGFLDSGTTVNFYTDANVSGYTLCGEDDAATPVLRYIGMNSTTNFRCYTSVNNNVKTGEYVWYHYIGSGSSSSVTWNLKSISVTTAPTKTTYTAGESFDPAGMVVTGHFEEDGNSSNTKDEAVTGYTVSPDGALSTSADHVTITYQGFTANQAITVNAAPVVTYDFETVAELNALVTSTSATYSGYLTNAVVSFAPSADTRVAIVKDATGSVMFYKSGHGLKQGQTYTGAIEVTAIKYNDLYSEVTAWDASFEGAEAVVAPETVALADLIGHFDDYQNAYVQVAGLTVSSQSGKNINVTDGTNNYVVYDNTGNITVEAGDVITAIGTITKYQTTEEIKVWTAADLIVTAGSPKAISFSQPSQTGCSIAVSVGGSSISSGTTVASGTTVTLTATVGSDYNCGSRGDEVAIVADASATTTTFTMGTSPVTISASFTSKVGGDPTLQYTLDGTQTGSGSNYGTDNTVTQNSINWGVMGNVTMNPWRIGGKNLSGVDRTVYSKDPIAANISSIKITHGAASNITVNSMTVFVATNSSFTTIVSTLTPTFAANGTVTVDRPSGVSWSNCYYKIVYNVSVSGNSNRFIQFTGAEFWGTN